MRMAPGSLLGRCVKMGTKCSEQHLCAVGAPSSMCTLAGIVPRPPEPMSSCRQPLIRGGTKSILLLPLAVCSPGWGFTPGPDESGYDNNSATAIASGMLTGTNKSKQGAPSIGWECWYRGTCSLPLKLNLKRQKSCCSHPPITQGLRMEPVRQNRSREGDSELVTLFEVLIKSFLKPYSDFSILHASDFQPVCHKGHTGVP